MAQPNPNFNAEEEPPAASDIKPTKLGPPAHPISPAKAKKANIAVPPVGQVFADRLTTPGHIIPTEKPHNAHPARERSGWGANTEIP